MNFNCVIIDDEKPARQIIKHYIQETPYLTFSAEFGNPLEGIQYIAENQLDILFLDIQMPQISGMDLIKKLRRRPAIILTTAYREFALEGFDLEVEDYLLKPISFERFTQSVTKTARRLEAFHSAAGTTDQPLHILKSGKKIFKIPQNEILFIQAMREYVAYQTKNFGRIVVYANMKTLEKELTGSGFIRVHRSYIVNTAQIRFYQEGTLKMENFEIPVSGTYKDDLTDWFNRKF